MKELLKELSDGYKNYQTLTKLKNSSEKVKCENITLKNAVYMTRRNKTFRSFHKVYETLENLPEEVKKWTLDRVFECKNLKETEEDVMKILFLKVSLAEQKKDLVSRKLELLKQIEECLSDENLEQVLKDIQLGAIEEEQIEQLTDTNILSFIEENMITDIEGLLALEEKNRTYYMKEYQENLKVILEHNDDSIIRMEHENFKEFIQVIKRRYPASFTDYQCVKTYDLLECLAKEYAKCNKKVISFALNAFPNFNSILEEGELPNSIKKLVALETENKEEEELMSLAKVYNTFLDVDSFSMQDLRYQLILEDRFIESKNKKYILMLMSCDDRIEFQRRKSILLESGIYEKENLEEDLLEEVIESKEQSLIGEKIKLVLSEEFADLATKNLILTRMNNVSTQSEAEKILDITKALNSEGIEEKEKDKLLNSMPGKEHILSCEDYSITILGLSSFNDYDIDGVVEMNKGPIKVLIRANNACKKS